MLLALGLFDQMTKADREAGDTDFSAYTDHMADQGTEAMEREKAALFATKEGRYLYRIEEALRRLYNDPENFGRCHGTGKMIAFERPDWPSPSDQDPPLAAATRIALLERLAADAMPFIGYHLPQGGLGRVEKAETGYRFTGEI